MTLIIIAAVARTVPLLALAWSKGWIWSNVDIRPSVPSATGEIL